MVNVYTARYSKRVINRGMRIVAGSLSCLEKQYLLRTPHRKSESLDRNKARIQLDTVVHQLQLWRAAN
jgi:hypothetical protein